MPIYGYTCQACGHSLDALQKMSDPPLVECPECGEATLKRQLSAPRFRLKGQGWYETDFKSDNKRNLAGDGDAAKADGKSDAKAETKPDTKPDAKADTKTGTTADKPATKATKSESKATKPASGDKAGAA